MKEHYEVTIGIPVYRSVNYILDTMMSVLNQTFPDIEFLIVDDCGFDGTMDVIERLQTTHLRGCDIRILRNDHNCGVSFSRNRIIDEALGAYLYFMDSDDEIESNTIEILHSAIVGHHAQVVYGSYEIIDTVSATQNKVYQKDSLVFNNSDEFALYAFSHNHIFHVSVCNILINIDFLRQSEVRFIGASYWEDMAFTTEMVTKVDRAVLLSDVTYHYLIRENSLSHYQKRDEFLKDDIMNTVGVLCILKGKCKVLRDKPYLPYLCYNLEMNSFYVVCHILKKYYRIVPRFNSGEIRQILKHPMTIGEILRFNNKRMINMIFKILSKLPNPLFLPSIWLLGKKKGVL